MIIDDGTLDKIAKLANIKIKDNEREKLKTDMTAILAWIEKLKEVDTTGIEPLTHMTNEINQAREDEVETNIPIEDALKNAKVKSGNYFAVPKVIKKNNG